MKRTLLLTGVGIVAVAGVCAAFVHSTWPDESNHGYSVEVSPRAPLSTADCRAEVTHQTGYKHGGGKLCAEGAGRAWFDIRLRNVSDDLGYPVCRVTALDDAGDPLFDQDVYLPMDFPSGPPVIRGTMIHFVWYLGDPANDNSYVQHATWSPPDIARYVATCHGRPDSQVPI
jgi:hypothetical protein